MHLDLAAQGYRVFQVPLDSQDLLVLRDLEALGVLLDQLLFLGQEVRSCFYKVLFLYWL